MLIFINFTHRMPMDTTKSCQMSELRDTRVCYQIVPLIQLSIELQLQSLDCDLGMLVNSPEIIKYKS